MLAPLDERHADYPDVLKSLEHVVDHTLGYEMEEGVVGGREPQALQDAVKDIFTEFEDTRGSLGLAPTSSQRGDFSDTVTERSRPESGPRYTMRTECDASDQGAPCPIDCFWPEFRNRHITDTECEDTQGVNLPRGGHFVKAAEFELCYSFGKSLGVGEGFNFNLTDGATAVTVQSLDGA